MVMTCAITSCGKPIKARGLCQGHYKRLQKYGDPLIGEPRGKWVRVLQRSKRLENYFITDIGCWQYLGKPYWGYGPHRLAWEDANNQSAKGLHIRHKCDNPLCINPAHLEAGTHYDNMQDMFLRGRANPVKGEKHYNAKLTADQVRDIRSASGSYREIAQRYDISKSYVCNLKAHRKWNHLCG
jgi:HNH endonuclease